MTVSLASSSNASFRWWRDAPSSAKRALIAAGLGWMLDAFDVMLYSLVLASLMRGASASDEPTAAAARSVTLRRRRRRRPRSSACIADRFGRTRALMCSVLALLGLHRRVRLRAGRSRSSRCSACCSGSAWAASGRAGRRWSRRRGRASIAARRSASCRAPGRSATPRRRSSRLVLPRYGWRAVFFVGVLPALLHHVDPAERRGAGDLEARAASRQSRLQAALRARHRRPHVALTLMNACTLFAWWGFNLWLPGYLALPVAQGGVGLQHRDDVRVRRGRCRSGCGSAT